ncbi:fibronectin type III domain-containing protein [Cellulomonas sp. PhB150]|uniref:Ig-like domain-containing protein n=1 Tax=Cellulomonas sp. PhB150 TaxID=2485188 RepID=UPI000F4A15E8|nr:fibronectin type III domain-containing protein [Cellulomonas sp. PhB150]ROS31032.1 fibronectin type III domain protein [Cellulomonas sp. PhB150]
MRWPRLRQRATTAAAVVTVPVLVAVLALVNQGFPLAKVDLNDGSVWVTATSQLKLGRYNVPVEELNAGLVTDGSTFDVLQDGGDVVLTQPDGFAVVDPATVTLGSQVAAPGADKSVSMAAGVLSVVGVDGGLYVRTLGSLEGLRVGTDAPDVALGEGGKAVVAPDGTVVAVDGTGEATRVAPGQAPADAGSVGEGSFDALTAVGDEPVVLRGSTVHTLHGSVELAGSDLVLQQPGPSSSRVLVSSSDTLYEVPLDGGKVVEHPTTGSGKPAAPVQVGSCAHAAWATATGSYLQLCDGKDAVVKDLQDTSAQDVLVFRVNRSMVVLNDTLRGRLWMPLQDTDLRTPNWDDIETPDDPEDQKDDSDSTETIQDLVTECSTESAPPAAADDEFGVRPGRATILPVIDNDSSPDCGVLVVSEVDDLPSSFGHVSTVYDGRALQVDVAPTATGTAQFRYTITDGRGTSAPSTATVTLTARPDDLNDEPEQIRTGSMKVEQGGQATYQALADFQDPDGDDLLLVGASVDDAVGSVSTRQDGSLTFTAGGDKLGRARVTLQVSDGTHTIKGTLDVDVRPAGSVPPQIDPVHAVAYRNQVVTVKPLDAVRSSSTEPVRLASVQDVPGATLTPDLPGGTFTFSAGRVGTYYVPFTVTAAPQQATGLARIDVKEWPADAPPPVAVRDRAFLPAGGEVTIDPLSNDSDPSGSVLVLQDVDVPDGSSISAAVLDHRLVQIRSEQTLDAPEVLTYTVSNGAASATGQIVVQPVPASATNQSPVVQNVEVTVRTGGIVTIPVLDTAYDPDGDPLSLVPELVEALGAGQGLMFVSGDVLRYQAPSTPITARATFEVTDGTSTPTAATVTVKVHASDAESKKPPRPKDVTARVFAGQKIRIPIPLVGIDEDGDGVTLLGSATAPKLGNVTDKGADWIEYTANDEGVGTDEFTYAVEDWVGQRATATIRVGISPRPTNAATVVARDDEVTIRPGQTIEVRVLANDIDSSGGELSIDPELDVPAGIDAKVLGRRIVVVAPAKNQTIQVEYRATNAAGGRDTAVLTVNVDDKAEVLRPIARDVVVPPAETFGLAEVSVDVLAVAQNPSGPLDDLAVSVPSTVADVARVDPSGNVIVTLVDHAQTVPFLLTNTTAPGGKVASYAFITVPALGDFPPTLRPNAPALRVASGEPLEIALDEYVKVAPGREPSVADLNGITASNSNGASLVGQDDGHVEFTSAKGFAGNASITIPVTDATSTSDTRARTAFLTLPITVYALEDHPPTFTPSVLEVAPGEAPIKVDLQSFTTGPEGATGAANRYSYSLASAVPPGFTATLEGTMLSVSAAESTAKGRTGQLALKVGYGRTGVLDTTIDLRVIASTRSTARVVDRSVPDGAEGQQVTLNVLDDAFNPFPDSPLKVVDAVVETPDSGTAGRTASTVSVRPNEGFIGSMVVRFRVRDVTGDPDRDAEGRITVTVRGKPATPTAPRVGEVRDRTVVLSWRAPDSRGTPITGYRLTAQPGNLQKSCASTTCTFDGLTNDTEYTFTVAAQNEVGWSDPSPASQPARPDAVPDAPGTPTVEFGDGRLDVSWNVPDSQGSPVTSYTVELTGGTTTTVTEVSTRHTFTGLSNGTSYTVRVRAHNDAPDPSGWSPSASETPAGVPEAPEVKADPTDTKAGRILEVTWSEPKSNGDRIGSYEVTVDGPGGTTATVSAGTRSYTFNDAETGKPYTVSVRAKNKAGWGSRGSVTASTFGLPGTPGGVAASAPVGDGSITVSWNPATDNGSPITAYEIKLPDGSPQSVGGSRTSATFTGLTGGTDYTYQVRSVNAAGSSEWSAAVTATATTPPGTPSGLTMTVSDRGNFNRPTALDISWNAASSGGGRGLQYTYVLSAGGNRTTGEVTTEQTSVTGIRIDNWIGLGGTDVTLRVWASTTNTGSGDKASQTQTFTWGEPPGAVSGLSLSPDDTVAPTRLSAAWTAGPSGGASVSFRVCWTVDGVDQKKCDDVDDTTASRTVGDLGDPAPGAVVKVVVTPHSSKGDGPSSAAEFTMPAAAGGG